MPKRNCPFCGHDLVRETREISYSYKGQSISVQQPGLYCDGCGESILEGNDLKVTRQAIHDMQCVADGLLTSVEVRRIRQKMTMTQKDAGEIFGGGVNAFSRYERGEIKQPKGTDIALRLIDHDIERLKEVSPKHYKLAARSHTREMASRLLLIESLSFSTTSASKGAEVIPMPIRKHVFEAGAQVEVKYN